MSQDDSYNLPPRSAGAREKQGRKIQRQSQGPRARYNLTCVNYVQSDTNKITYGVRCSPGVCFGSITISRLC